MNTFKIALIFSMSMLTTMSSNGQKAKFGKVLVQELRDTVHAIEEEAGAAILYQYGKREIKYNSATDRMEINTEVYRKIKIYKTEHVHLGELEILLYNSDEGVVERITSIDAFAYNLNGNKIEKSRLPKGEIFTTKRSDYWTSNKFAIPNVKKGSVIEYKYKISSPFLIDIPLWNFQYDIPCNESDYIVLIPEYYTYKERTNGPLPMNRKESSKWSSYTRQASDQNLARKTLNQGGFSLNESGKTKKPSVDYTCTVLNYHEENTPSLKDVDFVLNSNDFRLGVKFELESSRVTYEGAMKYYSKSWDDIANALEMSRDFGGQLDRKIKEYEVELDELKDLSDQEKITKVYALVQQNYTWNNEYALLSKDGSRKLLKEKVGNVADVNFLLINLLNQAGINAWPIITKRRYNGILEKDKPSLVELDYVFVVALLDGEKVFLDATDKFISAGELPLRALNPNGVLIDKSKSISIDARRSKGTLLAIENPNTEEINVYNTVYFGENLDLKCNESVKYFGTEASRKRRNLVLYSSEDEFIGKLEEQNPNYSIDSIKIMNKEISSKPLQINYAYTLDGNVDEVSGKLYINALLGNGVQKNPFVSEEREFPIYFDSKMKENYIISFKIPEGYEVDYLPETVNTGIPNGMGSYYFNLQAIGNMIQVHSTFSINEGVLPSQYFLPLKKLYDKAIEIGQQKIVLKKID